MLTVTAFELILSMNSCQTQSLGWYIFNQSRIRTWKTKYSKALRYPPLSVTSNPYQGLKHFLPLQYSCTTWPFQLHLIPIRD